ncbi:GntR family transcriptional regulator [Sphingobium fuliginis]|nr:GntR family transcriptional regulator [Sphingobium fuliginis]
MVGVWMEPVTAQEMMTLSFMLDPDSSRRVVGHVMPFARSRSRPETGPGGGGRSRGRCASIVHESTESALFVITVVDGGKVNYQGRMAEKSPAPSRTHRVYEQIRSRLLNGALPPGQKLVISDLCENLGANQSAVREALARVTAEGLVTAEPQRGFRVSEIAAEDLHHLTDVRLLIEEPCIRSAIANATIAWEKGIVAALHGLLRTPRNDDDGKVTQEWADAHHAFHHALVATCDNPWLLRVRDMLLLQSERYRWLSISSPSKRSNLEKEYSKLADAFLAHDADLAIKLMREHYLMTTKIVLGKDQKPARTRKASAKVTEGA